MPRAFPLFLAAAMLVPAVALVAPSAQAAHSVTQVTIASFDGTLLSATLFVPENATAESPVPFVLMTHGWAGSRTSTPTGRVAQLLDAGYGVLTWDSRGFGTSGGQVMLDSPDFEVKDVSALIDWVTANAPVATVDGDPLIGMNGVSYAGGIQLLAAAFDERIDVITPEITWNNLVQALGPNGVPKFSWIQLLFFGGAATSCQTGHSAAGHGCQTELLAKYYAQVEATNTVTDEVRDALLYRSPATYMDRIDIPTLLVQGFPDTLFDVDQAVANYNGIKANGAPVKLWLYDGGHILPHESAPNSQAGLIGGVVVNWLDCYLKQVAGCDTGPEVEYYSTDGVWRSASSWPPASQTTKTLVAYETIVSPGFDQGQEGRGFVTLETASVNTTATGSLRATLTVFSTGPTVFYAALGVKDAAGKVTRIGQQNQPIRIDSTVPTNTVSVDLVSVSPVLQPGQSLVLMLQSFDPDFNSERTPGVPLVTRMDLAWQSGPA